MDPMPIPAAPEPDGPGRAAPGPPYSGDGPVPASWSPAPSPPAGPPASLVRRLLPPLATLAVVAAAFTYVGLVDPNETGHYPVCPLYGLTGVYCPGCGGLRSAHAVAHGDLSGALGDNAVAVLGYAAFAVLWVAWVVRARKRLPLRIALAPAWWWALGGLVLAFSVVRNLPFGSSLAP
ncbi:DUF2752 domain-containing protein [Streptomyces sp. AK02-01A]|uniref:DUF2752 domain-containing protein n=1 Tax=Streptomyces sp. AK02-01A TaxID=3028648 RepID=UPI0029B9CB9C|nr:DUF2752 domain-containing protein [Streptomyces sp. AK02-01A]MDX3852820.1 DUF2752 domain-containing protein [Streptomyces sp. AK02-01A]